MVLGQRKKGPSTKILVFSLFFCQAVGGGSFVQDDPSPLGQEEDAEDTVSEHNVVEIKHSRKRARINSNTNHVVVSKKISPPKERSFSHKAASNRRNVLTGSNGVNKILNFEDDDSGDFLMDSGFVMDSDHTEDWEDEQEQDGNKVNFIFFFFFFNEIPHKVPSMVLCAKFLFGILENIYRILDFIGLFFFFKESFSCSKNEAITSRDHRRHGF